MTEQELRQFAHEVILKVAVQTHTNWEPFLDRVIKKWMKNKKPPTAFAEGGEEEVGSVN